MSRARKSAFEEQIVDALDSLGQLRTRRMFGGLGIYQGPLFFALISNDELYFKVGDANRSDFEKRGARWFEPPAPRRTSMSYAEVPLAILERPAELKRWAEKAIAVAREPRASTRKHK